MLTSTYEAVTLGLALNAVDGARKLKLVVLDACRSNPLEKKTVLRVGAMRSVDRGLGRIEPRGEVLVAYSAKARTVAWDGAKEGPRSKVALGPGLRVVPQVNSAPH
jgi:hypothetical protein